jgi:tetratricopeptide (TPR) repeat protein
MVEAGKFYRDRGDYEEAETMLLDALYGYETKLGSDHPHTLQSKHELAILYMQQTRHDEAEQLLLDAFNGRTTKLGSEHPHTLDSLRNLIQLYEAWNKPEKAEEWRAKLPQTRTVEQQ